MNPHVALAFSDVCVRYDDCLALHRICGEVRAGSLTAIIGPNGAGKSTLLKAIMGDVSLVQGRIEGVPRTIGYLPQVSTLDRQFPLSVADTVLMGAWEEMGAFGCLAPAASRRVEEALENVGLPGFGKRSIGALSVGQFQRVLFARLILENRAIILLDEPFNAVDSKTTDDLLSIIGQWHQQGRTVLAVLHDHDHVRTSFPETLLLAHSVVAWGKTESVLTSANLNKARAACDDWEHTSPDLPTDRFETLQAAS